MAITRTRRLAPLLIATTLAVGGVSLASTSAFAAPATTASVTTDGDNPGANRLVGMLGKLGNLSKIGSDAARGGDTEPPGGDSAETPQTPKWKLPIMTDEPQGKGGNSMFLRGDGGAGGKTGEGGTGGNPWLTGDGAAGSKTGEGGTGGNPWLTGDGHTGGKADEQGGNGGNNSTDVGPRLGDDYAIYTAPDRPTGPVVN
ncbi:hypothetical protein [Streptomyces sp. NBC_00207]|uniref:hypothetical protein n=1 Tax=unclassified Streptomyces TaxID=2593676 RepID=UPI002885B90F|nr:hypothetical protein [Streptomyces sp. DSM 41633]